MSIKTLLATAVLFILLAGMIHIDNSVIDNAEAIGKPQTADTGNLRVLQQENRSGGLPSQPFDVLFKDYFMYANMTTQLQRLAKNYPDIARLEDLTLQTDHGSTWQGRSLFAMKISDNVEVEEPGEPKVVILGNIHAREWMAYEVPMYFIFHLLENYEKPATDNDGDGLVNEDIFNGKDDDEDGLVDEDWSEGRITYLVNNREIWVVPTLNPDGTVIDQEMQSQGSGSWRKNARDNNENGEFEPDYDGVDLNRNFPYMWDANQQGIISEDGVTVTLDSSLPSSGTYRGPQDNFDDDGDSIVPFPDIEDKDGGFSEPETQAIEGLMNRLDSDGFHHNMRSDVGISLAYHAVGGWVIWPWGFTQAPAPNEDLLVHIGHEYMDQTGYTSWWEEGMYMTSGDSDDYLYGSHGALAYTIELNDEDGAGFHPPAELIINTSRKLLSCNLFSAEMTGVAKIAKEEFYPDLNIGLPVLYHNQRTKVISNIQSYKVTVEVENYANLDPNSMILHYRVGSNMMYRSTRMTEAGEITVDDDGVSKERRLYTGKIPAMTDHDGSTVYYYITGEDVRGLMVSGPIYGEGEPYSYRIDARFGFTLFDAAVAILMTIIFIVIVWGGFFRGVNLAIKADRRKARLR
jgi:hypothetical protein